MKKHVDSKMLQFYKAKFNNRKQKYREHSQISNKKHEILSSYSKQSISQLNMYYHLKLLNLKDHFKLY